jgi:tripartite-type tricarboxylate transporter receptor subunit TctC
MLRMTWLLAAAILFAIADPAFAADDFYKGKTIRLQCGCSTGAGYDNHARILSRHMPKHIPGNPTIVVQNQPAAGGLATANHMFSVADKDGTEMGLLNRYTLLQSMLGVEQAKYKVEEFNWLGTTVSFSDNAHTFIVRADVAPKNIEDLRDPKAMPISVGNSGSALIRVIKEGLHVNMNIIEGYTNNDLDTAFERKEIDGHAISYLSMMLRAPQWIEKGFAKPMIQFGRETRLPQMPDVPTGRELARNPEDLALVRFAEAPLLIGYPFTLPPGVPADRVALMRKAFKDTMEDPDYRADVLKSKLELTPKYGDEVQAALSDMAKSPASAMKRYKDLLGDSPG